MVNFEELARAMGELDEDTQAYMVLIISVLHGSMMAESNPA